MNPSSWNKYSYTNGDPVNHSDPTGLFVEPGYPNYCDEFPEDPECWVPWPVAPPPDPGQTPLQLVTPVLAGMYQGGLLSQWATDDGLNYGLSFTAASDTLPALGAACTFGPAICTAVAVGGAIAIGWPLIEDVLDWIYRQNPRGYRDPAQVKNLPKAVPGTKDPNGDCIPPDPSQKGPAGLTYKWQQRSSSPLSDPNAVPHWHWTLWNFNVIDCNWFYNGRGDALTDPGPGYTLIPGIF
jgi:hypothetical protein